MNVLPRRLPLCEIVPEDGFYHRFRQTVYPLIKDEDFSQMYCCGDNDRPAISPPLLAMAAILQFHRDLSDRQMDRVRTYDTLAKSTKTGS